MLNLAVSTSPPTELWGIWGCSSLLMGQYPDSWHYFYHVTSQAHPGLLTVSGLAESFSTLPIYSLVFSVLLLLRQYLFQELILHVGVIQYFLATHHPQQCYGHKSSRKYQNEILFKDETIYNTPISTFLVLNGFEGTGEPANTLTQPFSDQT